MKFWLIFLSACATSELPSHSGAPIDQPTPAQSAPQAERRYAQPPGGGQAPLLAQNHATNPAKSAQNEDVAPVEMAPPSSATHAKKMAPAGVGSAGQGEPAPSLSPPQAMNEPSLPNADMDGASRGAVADDRSAARDMVAPRHEERPGLATSWGEDRYSQVTTVPFERDSYRPNCQGSIAYNDRDGIEAAAQNRVLSRASLAIGCGVSLQLRDENGNVLPAARSGSRVYALGHSGQRYTITVVNNSNARYEAVVSVDGLDVMDGMSASSAKRGYLVPAHGEVTIDGFRRSEADVAAFRFGSVSNSYAALSGGDVRNVGVIGIAAFAEKFVPPPYSWRELRQRQEANPFPSEYSQPPPFAEQPFIPQPPQFTVR